MPQNDFNPKELKQLLGLRPKSGCFASGCFATGHCFASDRQAWESYWVRLLGQLVGVIIRAIVGCGYWGEPWYKVLIKVKLG